MVEIIANPSVTKAIIAKYGLFPNKRFGQNFLIDANIVNKIAASSCDKDTITVEIGPGIGSLSQFLLKYSKRVYAHEIDKKLIEALAEIFAGELDVLPGDFLKVDFDTVPYSDQEIIVCANLPYYITTPVLFKLFASNLHIKKICVMVQKEVANRFLAGVNSPDYGALSVITAVRYEVRLLMRVSRLVFYPAPDVDSAVITFLPKEPLNVDHDKFDALVKASFKQPRKTLKNNLDTYLKTNSLPYITSLHLKETVRAQELSLEDYISLYRSIHED